MTILSRRHSLISLAALTLMGFGTAFAEEAKSPEAAAAGETKPVLVFAAASLKDALGAVQKAWEAKTGNKASISFAASSALAKQLESGAPADLFVSADHKWMDYASEKKLIDAASRTNLLGNTLVLVAPKDATVDLKIAKGFELAKALGDGRLAMGDPKAVPAGIYGQAALTSLGVWDQVSAKIAGAENVRAALTFVARGEAPLGIVYGTDATSEPAVKVVDTFPADSHPPIIYPAALTTTSAADPAARDFLAFLTSSDAKALFEAQGFTVLK